MDYVPKQVRLLSPPFCEMTWWPVGAHKAAVDRKRVEETNGEMSCCGSSMAERTDGSMVEALNPSISLCLILTVCVYLSLSISLSAPFCLYLCIYVSTDLSWSIMIFYLASYIAI